MKGLGYPEFVLTTPSNFNFQTTSVYVLFPYTGDPPRITTHPKEFKDVRLGQPVAFTVHATGAEPISYQWQWKGRESEEWQVCESSCGTTLELPSVQKSDEGSYRCVVSNCAGSQISKAGKLCIGKDPCFSQLYENISNFALGISDVP